MKNKNPFILLSVIWGIVTIFCSVGCVVQFVDGKFVFAIIVLCMAIACAFVLGMLVEMAHLVSKANERILVMERIEKMFDDYRKSLNKKNEPFDEFNVPFPEVKIKENKKDEN